MTFDPKTIVSKSHENTSKYMDTVTLFSKTWTKGHWPLDDLDPTSVEVICVTLPKDHCVKVSWEYINVCGYSDNIFQNLNQDYHMGKSRNRRTFSKIENLRFLQNYDDYNCIFGIKLKGLSLPFIWRVMQWN